MVNNNKMDGIDVLCKFYQLSEEEQKVFLKKLLFNTIKTDVADPAIVSEVRPETTEESMQLLTDAIDKATTSLVDTLYSDDRVLRVKIFADFITDYDNFVQLKREELCDDNHDFTEWEQDAIERPHYALDGDSTEKCYAPVYIRVCKNCGLKQIAYSKSQRKNMEVYTEYRKNNPKTKKLINKPNTEN